MKPYIVVECDNDELLLVTLGAPRKRIKHEGNRDQVVKYVLKHPEGRSIGLVDEDPGTARSPKRRAFIAAPPVANLHVESTGKHRLVVLRPFLEGWLCQAVHRAGGKMTALDKGLSDDPRELHRILSPRGDGRMKKIVSFLEQKRSTYLLELKKALLLD